MHRSEKAHRCVFSFPSRAQAGSVELVHCDTQEQLADVMTKPLKLDAFLKLRGLLGVCSDIDIN